MKELEKLLKLGLRIEQRSSREPNNYKYLIYKPKLNPKNSGYNPNSKYGHYFEDIDKPIELEDVCSNLYFVDGRWIFEVWEYVPGPGVDDFVCEFTQPQMVINAIINFYFGKPTMISGWLFPLHRHPELNTKNILIVLRDLINIDEEAFHTIVERRQHFTEKLFLLNRWKRALLSQFILIPNIEDNTIYLALRRDMQEFYIVHKE